MNPTAGSFNPSVSSFAPSALASAPSFVPSFGEKLFPAFSSAHQTCSTQFQNSSPKENLVEILRRRMKISCHNRISILSTPVSFRVSCLTKELISCLNSSLFPPRRNEQPTVSHISRQAPLNLFQEVLATMRFSLSLSLFGSLVSIEGTSKRNGKGNTETNMAAKGLAESILRRIA